MTVRHHVFATAIDPCGVAWNERGLAAVQLPERVEAETAARLAALSGSAGPAEPPQVIAAVIADIRRYLAGERIDFSAVPVDLDNVDPFRRKLLDRSGRFIFGRKQNASVREILEG